MLQFISLLPQLLIQFIYCWAHSSLNSIFTGISRNDRSNSRTRFWLSQINCMTGPKNSGSKNKYFHHFYFHDYKKILNFFIEPLEYSQKHGSYFLFIKKPSSNCSSCLWWSPTRRFDGGQIFKSDDSAFTTQQGASQGPWRKSNYLVNIINSLN